MSSMETLTAKQRAHPRKLNVVKARKLRDQGLSYERIGAALGVSRKTVERHLNPEQAEYIRAYQREYVRRATCPDCGAVVTETATRSNSRCVDCANKAKAVTVRPTTLRCSRCGRWKPDRQFSKNVRNVARRGRQNRCRGCVDVPR